MCNSGSYLFSTESHRIMNDLVLQFWLLLLAALLPRCLDAWLKLYVNSV